MHYLNIIQNTVFISNTSQGKRKYLLMIKNVDTPLLFLRALIVCLGASYVKYLPIWRYCIFTSESIDSLLSISHISHGKTMVKQCICLSLNYFRYCLLLITAHWLSAMLRMRTIFQGKIMYLLVINNIDTAYFLGMTDQIHVYYIITATQRHQYRQLTPWTTTDGGDRCLQSEYVGIILHMFLKLPLSLHFPGF